MNPLLFVHVPKTAGTSFRLGASAYFGDDSVCFDYGPNSSETSDVVRKWMGQNPDHWSFFREIKYGNKRLLSGHSNAMRYLPVFGLENTVTILRDPIQRLVSEYMHFSRHHGYEGDFESFYKKPTFTNRQGSFFKGLPWPVLGFIGLTERYEESLRLLNRKYDVDIPILTRNLWRSDLREKYELPPNQLTELRKRNADEIGLYEKAVSQFEWRVLLSQEGEKFVAGLISTQNKGRILGCAIPEQGDDAVVLRVIIDGVDKGEVLANENRPGLRANGARRGGFVGFSIDVSGFPEGAVLECKVAETGQPLVNSPWVIQNED
ncbi:hypothetical protein ACL7TT_02680 [Microbulbifer sp. 2304DJ12-6]|uniref:hypothetical protein n=1 Tax=Microbulbifer sp. 2304DJ12-6 TaxID=3233340 RepID=UPI0039B0C54B